LKQECGGNDAHPSALPDARLIFADRFVAFDHVANQTFLVALADANTPSPEPWFDEMEAQFARLGPLPDPCPGTGSGPVTFKLQHDKSEYLSLINEALREIDCGESYEVCLTNKLLADVKVNGFELYRTLQRVNPAPFSAYLHFPEATVISSSPERFLRIGADGWIETKPIKGTVRRDTDPIEDRRLAQHMQKDEKTRAENLMIVDLLRNDLGRVCETGTVTVPKLMDVETYATVHQLVSTIKGRLAPGKSVMDCLKSAFPGGSMTGAPKVRTMEIIDRLEKAARGVYSGTIGYIGLGGIVDLSIVIRTIVATPDQVSIGVGGAKKRC
jgi:para-aminobenzoate synthetase